MPGALGWALWRALPSVAVAAGGSRAILIGFGVARYAGAVDTAADGMKAGLKTGTVPQWHRSATWGYAVKR